MIRFIVHRLMQSVIVVIGVTLVTFLLIHLSGDPVVAMADQNWTDEQIESVRESLGLDRPWYVQYGKFLGRLAQGDLGVSWRQQQPALDLVLERLPATLQLAAAAFALSLVVSVPVGFISATRRGQLEDRIGMVFALLGQSMPVFWLGLLLILTFSVQLGWLPVAGRSGWHSLILPAITLSAMSMGRNARIVRSSLLEVLGMDYVRTARAKGLNDQAVLIRHAFRNALIPVVTLIALELGALLSGAVITETIFAWPGLGRLAYQAVLSKDLPLVQASVITFTLFFVLVNFSVDIIYGFLDPRIRRT